MTVVIWPAFAAMSVICDMGGASQKDILNLNSAHPANQNSLIHDL